MTVCCARDRAPTVFVLCALLVALCVSARAAPDCMSLSEARAAFPNVHLWYRLDGGRRCWSDNGPTRRQPTVHRPRAPLAPSMPAPRPTSVLWPTLVATEPSGAALFRPDAMTAWPLLLDVDEITAETPVAELPECCWPPLDEPVTEFRERWFAMPSSWFLAAIGERLGQ